MHHLKIHTSHIRMRPNNVYTYTFSPHTRKPHLRNVCTWVCMISTKLLPNCNIKLSEVKVWGYNFKSKTNDIWLLFGFCLTDFFIVCVFFFTYIYMLGFAFVRSHIFVIRVRFCMALKALGNFLSHVLFLGLSVFFIRLIFDINQSICVFWFRLFLNQRTL